jgi:nucleolar protein 4
VSSVERSQDKLRSLLAPLGKGSLRSAKVMLDMERKRGGLAQSRGYGFVEFKEHAHALACLRELNNNSAYCSSAAGATSKTGLRPRLIVEFTLENMQKVMILKRREERAVKRKTDSLETDPSSDDRGDQEQPTTKKPKTSSSSSSAVAASVAAAPAAPGESGKKRQREDDVADDSEQQQKQLRDKKLAEEKRKAVEKKRKEKVLARKLKKEGSDTATTSSLPNDASCTNKRKGLFGRIRAEKKEKKRAAKV